MGIFGWDYPPGCSSTPYDDPIYCEICGRSDDHCICPHCPTCGEVGDPECYDNHGLVRTPAQIESLRIEQEKWESGE